jgi:hypothetical protein
VVARNCAQEERKHDVDLASVQTGALSDQ